MIVRGDIESVNLRTGERFQRVVGLGESRLESLGKPLTKEGLEGVRAFERHMKDAVIPKVLKTLRRREQAYEKIKHIPLFG